MTLFQDEWADRQAELDASFGERFLFEPATRPVFDGMIDVDARPIDDDARAIRSFLAIFVDRAEAIHAHGRSMADRTTRAMVSGQPMLDVVMAQLPQPLQAGDVIRRDATGERFQVRQILPEELGRAWIMLEGGSSTGSAP